MIRSALRAGALLCATAAQIGFAPALADTNNAPPAEKFAIAPGGVDMRSGRYVYSQTDLAIGAEGAALTLTRSLAQPVVGHVDPFGNFSHNWDILLAEKRINIQQGQFQHGWGLDYQIEIVFGGRSQTFRGEHALPYFDQTARSGFATLTHAGDRDGAGAVYTYQTGDGAVAVFRAIGSGDCSATLRCAYVSHVTEADGTRYDFGYDATGGNNTTRLRRVTSNRGHALLLEYDGALVVKACVLNLTLAPAPAANVCPAGAQATSTYGYTTVQTGSGTRTRLATAVEPGGAAWTFVNAPNTIGFRRPGEATPWLTNGFGERMRDDGAIDEIMLSQSFADGTSYVYNFEESPFVPGQVPQIAGGTFTDGQGNVTRLRYGFPRKPDPQGGHGDVGDDGGLTSIVWQVTPGPVEVTDPLGRVTTSDYCDPNTMAQSGGCLVSPLAVSVTDPEGIRTELVWDLYERNLIQSRQVAPAQSGLADIVRSWTYSCSQANFRFCAKPVTATDGRGAVTDYAYAQAHGGIVSETGPAVNGVRPQTRYEYAQRRAWIADGSGGWVQAATPVWLPVATSACRTGAATGNPAAPCAVAGDEVRTAFDYGPDAGPNNLLLRGQAVTATDGGVETTLRTCFRHDALGRRIAETRPNAEPASCP